MNNSPSFNLLDEPWIPVQPLDGAPREVGLRESLLEARHFRGLLEASPPSLVALHRLLIALLHRALTTKGGPWRDGDRKRWLREGLPGGPLSSYLEAWRPRFWLFHPELPFMQVPMLAQAEETRDRMKPWTQVALRAASGNAPTLFDHTLDETPEAVSPAVVLRAMLGYLQYTPGGLVRCLRFSDKAGPLANTAAVLAQGATLEETLILGLHPYSEGGEGDSPAWEKAPPGLPELCGEPTLATGPNDRYTRLTRAVLFRLEEDGKVRFLRFGAGLALAEDPNALDPMACHRLNEDGKPFRISFAEGRAVWRDLPALLPDQSGRQSLPPAVLHWAGSVWDQALRHVLVAGLSSDQAKLLRWRLERQVLPQPMIEAPEKAQELRKWVSAGEETYRKMRELGVALYAAALPSPGHKDTRKRAREMVDASPIQGVYFSVLERAFPRLMDLLVEGEAGGAAAHWGAALAEACWAGWKTLSASLGQSPGALRAEARVRPRLLALVRDIHPSAEGEPKA